MWMIHRKMRSRMKEWPPGGGGGGIVGHYRLCHNTEMCEHGIMAVSRRTTRSSTSAYTQWFYVLSVFFILTPAFVSAQCPVQNGKCHCEVQGGKNIINCRYQGLKEVPSWTASQSSFYELTLANNDITELRADTFSGLRIQRLDLSANKIISINPAAFQGIEGTLEELLLHVNSMDTFPKEALAGLVNLKFLVVEGFNISALPSGALATQTKIHTLKLEKCLLESVVPEDLSAFNTELTELSLSTNRLINIPQTVVSGLQKLDTLDVSHNKLNVLADNLFSGNRMIKKLDFSNNQLQTVRPNAYIGLENSLETLIVQNNKLTDNQLPPLKVLRAIKSLNLANNQFITIPEDTFTGISTIEFVNLRTNRLEALLKAPFVPLTTSLKTLELAENNIKNIESGFFGAFQVLEVLDLHGQNLNGALTATTFDGLENSLLRLNIKGAKLTSADWQAVGKLAKLQSLNLAENEIMQIPPFSLQQLKGLETLDISYNRITEISQRGMHGPQSTLSSVKLTSNGLETIPQCTFYMFTKLDAKGSINLGKNPLRCDCGLVWLRQWVEEKYPTEIDKLLLYDWRCASPTTHAGKQFPSVSTSQLCPTNPTPTPAVCEDLTLTTTPIPTGSSTVSPTGEPSVKATNITHDSAWVRWTVWGNSIPAGFVVDSFNKNSGKSQSSERLAPDARQYLLKGLSASTSYTTCVSFLYNETAEERRLCQDFVTAHEPAARTGGGTNVGAIVGAVIGVLALLALLILLGFLVVRSRTGGARWFTKPAWLGGGGTDSSATTNKWRTPTGVPQIGYNSKRFSRPKSRETLGGATASTTSSQLQNRANSELEMKLAGFSPEERDRIINMLTTTGGSTASIISSGSSQRYVPELPPRPQHLEGYLNPQSIKDEHDDPYAHIYDEIPGGNGNYYETPISSGGATAGAPGITYNNVKELRGSTASVHSGKYTEPYEEKQDGACYI